MRLYPNQLSIVAQYVKSYPNARCPVCQSSSWKVSETVFELPEYQPGQRENVRCKKLISLCVVNSCTGGLSGDTSRVFRLWQRAAHKCCCSRGDHKRRNCSLTELWQQTTQDRSHSLGIIQFRVPEVNRHI